MPAQLVDEHGAPGAGRNVDVDSLRGPSSLPPSRADDGIGGRRRARVGDGEAGLEERVVRTLGQKLAHGAARVRAGGQLLLVSDAVAIGMPAAPSTPALLV